MGSGGAATRRPSLGPQATLDVIRLSVPIEVDGSSPFAVIDSIGDLQWIESRTRNARLDRKPHQGMRSSEMDGRAADIRVIRDLIERQFASMSWSAGGGPDTVAFRDDFLPSASLYPSARPVSVRSLDEFTERMGELARTTLRSFHERVIGTKILVFGNVAVAAVACENTENGGEVNRNVEMLLLVKSDGHWKIAAQAWDKETHGVPIPDELLVES
jgi:hypothetical protein